MDYFIGSININNGYPKKFGGQVQKNRLIRSYFNERNLKVKYFDTIDLLSKLKAIFSMVFIVNSNDKIIISTSLPSSYYIIKLLYFLRKIKSFKVYYWVIGGSLAKRVDRGEFNRKYLNIIDTFFVESEEMRETLLSCLTSDIKFIPNFKDVDVPVKFNKNESLNKLVYLSQVSEEKGIFDLMKTIVDSGLDFSLDIYGNVVEKDSIKFFKLISESDKINYKGFLDFNSSEGYKKLSGYSFMVFPTKHVNEGFPGVLVDCFIAGIPVIATDWNLNAEIIKHNSNGFIYNAKSSPDLVDTLSTVSDLTIEEYDQMRKNARGSKKQYDYKSCIDICIKEMQLNKS